MRNRRPGIIKPTAALFLGQCILATGAHAYTRPGHLEITNGAYQIMRSATATPATGSSAETLAGVNNLVPINECSSATSPCGRVVSSSEWTQFRVDVDWARRLIGSQPHLVPIDKASTGADCFVDAFTHDLADLPVQLSASHHQHNNNQCGITSSPEAGLFGFYKELAQRADGTQKQGWGLGWHAKNRDDDMGETTIEAPVGSALGIPEALETGARISRAVGAAAFAPFACLVKVFSGSDESCLDIARRWSDKTNLAAVVSAAIPGFGVPTDERFIGLWHLINVQRSGTYNDHPGTDLPNAGPSANMGAMDQVIMLGSSMTSARLDAGKSTGDDRYQFSDGGSKTRQNWEWRAYNVGVTEFSPLDNLARHGWDSYASTPTKRLGWPLHAIGDATVPMHVVATTGHGHAVYEKWVETNIANLLFSECVAGDTSCSAATLRTAQAAQAKRVLMQALRWRDFLVNNGGDVRGFITSLAQQTLSNVGSDLTAWPWCDACDVFDSLGDDGSASIIVAGVSLSQVYKNGFTFGALAKNPIGYFDSQREKIRSLVEDAMAAKIGFLVWSARPQNTPNQCIASGHVGCFTNGSGNLTGTATRCCTPTDICDINGRCSVILN